MPLIQGIPLYKRIASEILKQIKSKKYIKDTLPSEENLAANMGVSKHTIREALAELTSLSYISKRHGIGNKIIKSVLDTQFRIDANMNFIQLLHRSGYDTHLEQMNFRTCRKILRGFEMQEYYAYDEILYANDIPATQHHIYIPKGVFSDLTELNQCPEISLFDLFLEHQIVAHHSIVDFVATLTDDKTKSLFHLPELKAINTWEEVIFDNNDHMICITKIKFNPTYFPLRMVRKDFEIID